jgi:hypothetical protein
LEPPPPLSAAPRDADVFIVPGDIHPNMEHKESEIEQLRLLAGQLSADWRNPGGMAAPALARYVCVGGALLLFTQRIP